MNLPNILTLARIIMIPLMVVCFYWLGDEGKLWAAFIFWLAGVTDWFDGYLARKLNQSTPLGAFLDPVADKLIVAVAFVLLVEQYSSIWVTIPACIIIGREIVISALREWMAELGKRASVAVSYVGKVKTFLQMSAIFFLMAGQVHIVVEWIGWFSLFVAAVLTIWSMLIYLKAAWPELMGKPEVTDQN
ncbi:CDP-diacylglycerol--glycerol-3-phosphate 3-phosphatidyltransferase [Bacterioplanoides sp.]|uniref:CDP-diacylglycerol--glycerol-3-phosphate 3-phosphatidyltransferase n=1 Tax=Bacterioplanoides sp. TaxID=2066072 RepID=UPI003AFF66E0